MGSTGCVEMSEPAAGRLRPAADRPCRRPPIDRGWAWVVAAAAFGIFGIQGGTFKLSGIIYVQLVEHFGADPKLTLWVISASGLSMLLAGPAAALILSKTSHRFIALMGSLLLASGAILTGFSPIMEVTFLTFGIIYGFGCTCLHISGLTCTVPYFDRHRGLAIGLTATGSGVMSFVLPNVMAAVYEAYTFSGAMLIYAGILLQATVLGCFLRPMTLYSRPENLPRTLGGSRRPQRLAQATEMSSIQTGQPASESSNDAQAGATERQPLTTDNVKGRPPTTPDPGCSSASAVSTSLDNCEDKTKAEEKREAVRASPHSAGNSGRPFDCRLLKSEKMWVIGLIMLFTASGVNIAFVVMAPHGDAIGLPRATTSMLISVSGALEIACRGLHGWFSDRHLMPALVQFGLCTGLTGLSALLCPLIGGAAGLGLFAATCGACGTSVYSLVVVLIRELLGADQVTAAMGIQMLFQAVSVILSTLAVAFLTDANGAWDSVFYYIGGNLTVSSVICLAYATLLRARSKRLRRS